MRANYNFVTAIRPGKNDESGDYECPRGYIQCGPPAEDMTSKETMEKHRENIICVEEGSEERQCPITNIKFVESSGGNNVENTGTESTMET